MDFSFLSQWIATIASLSALIIGLVTVLWAYTKFIVERGLLPPTQFEIECNPLGTQQEMTLLEIVLHLRNSGSSALIATNLRLDLRYIKRDQVPKLVFLDGTETPEDLQRKRVLFGRLDFPGSVRHDLDDKNEARSRSPEPVEDTVPSVNERQARTWWSRAIKKARKAPNKRQPRSKRGFSVMPHDSFVQPGIDQQYAFATAVPSSTAYVLVWSSFEYAQSPKLVQRAMLWLSRRLGLIQFSLRHVREAHTAERVFKLPDSMER